MAYINEHLREFKMVKKTMIDSLTRHYHVGSGITTKMVGLNQINRFCETIKDRIIWAFALRVSFAISTLIDKVKDEKMTPEELAEELLQLKKKIIIDDSGSKGIQI